MKRTHGHDPLVDHRRIMLAQRRQLYEAKMKNIDARRDSRRAYSIESVISGRLRTSISDTLYYIGEKGE